MSSAAPLSPSTSPSSATATMSKRGHGQGPCYLKMLVSNLVAGSIIGKSGSVIASIENSTGVSMKLSASSQFFPGSTERIVVMNGDLEQINSAMLIILDKIGDVTSAQYVPDSEQNKNCELTCKIVVPKSSVSGIIGKSGQQIKQLQEQTKAKIKISDREQGLNERVVSISGALESIRSAALTICSEIQEDTHLRDNMYVAYRRQLDPAYTGGNAANNVTAYTQFPATTNAALQYSYGSPFSSNPTVSSASAQSAGEMESLMMEPCEMHLEIPDTTIGFIIGKGGMYLTDIMRSTNAVIKLSQKGDLVPGTQMRKVSISGTLSSVHRAHAKIVLRLKEANAVMAYNKNQIEAHQPVSNSHPMSPNPFHHAVATSSHGNLASYGHMGTAFGLNPGFQPQHQYLQFQ